MKTITTSEALNLIYTYGSLGEVFHIVFWSRTKSAAFDKEMKKSMPNIDKLAENKDIWREMTCRIGVKKGVKGVGSGYDPKDYRLLVVYDMELARNKVTRPELLEPEQLNGLPFRSVPFDNIVWLSIHGQNYLVTEDNNG